MRENAFSFLLCCLISPSISKADTLQDNSARLLAQMTRATCAVFVGDVAGLRGFMTSRHVSLLDPRVAIVFQKKPGLAYDASIGQARFALLSDNDGTCTIYAYRANAALAFDVVGRSVAAAGWTITPVGSRNTPLLETREYLLSKAKGTASYVISTSTAEGHTFQAAVTISPRADQPGKTL